MDVLAAPQALRQPPLCRRFATPAAARRGGAEEGKGRRPEDRAEDRPCCRMPPLSDGVARGRGSEHG
jgi:hypothetical protein